MKREVVQDFLNLPGIAGVALMDGRSRPYFCGVDQTLNFQQKEALAQGIQQVVETTPASFKFFEFQFTGHQVYIYKLEHGIILLVLTGSDLVDANYQQAIECLKTELQEDISNAIATFRLLAGNITLSNQNYWKGNSDGRVTASNSRTSPSHPSSPAIATPVEQNRKPSPLSATALSATEPSSFSQPVVQTTPVPERSVSREANLKELLAALNHLSQFTIQYLGTVVVANYWKSTRPQSEWLAQFQIDRAAHLTLAGTPNAASTQTLTTEQHQEICNWTDAFIQRCAKVIRDFPLIVEQRALDEHQRFLLLNQTP
jgi:hypothetical protein